eukprot:gene36333-48935_t
MAQGALQTLVLEPAVGASSATTLAGFETTLSHRLEDVAQIWRTLTAETIESPGQQLDFIRLWTVAFCVAEADQFYIVARDEGIPVALIPLQLVGASDDFAALDLGQANIGYVGQQRAQRHQLLIAPPTALLTNPIGEDERAIAVEHDLGGARDLAGRRRRALALGQGGCCRMRSRSGARHHVL